MIDVEYFDKVITNEISSFKYVNLKNVAKLGYSNDIKDINDFFNNYSNILSSGLSDALTFCGSTCTNGQNKIVTAANQAYDHILDLNKKRSNSLLKNIPENPTLSQKVDIFYGINNVLKIL